ncbi:HNH endonuclease [Streptomyces lydicus]|uniref:HNH endonuclease n=1 Tax=Streptomyces lydicus TaxID=47763 RepID=UPI0036FDDAF0
MELYKRAVKVSDYGQARTEWKRYRSTVGAKSLVATLEKMAGSRKRCVYCCDSRSSDIDHFKPVKLDYRLAFQWKNFILICPECNRCKGAKFAYADDGYPLLIDPTAVDPWEHLFLDVDTGVIAPRFRDESYDSKGDYTLAAIPPVNDEATVEGRRRAAEKYIELAEMAAMEGDSASSRRAIVKAVKYDEFGIASWFTLREGKYNSAFLLLQENCPMLWRKFCVLACKQALNALKG